MHEEQARGRAGDLRVLLRIIRRRFGVIVLCTLCVTGAALTYSLLQEKQYTAQATLLFRDPQFDQKLFGSTLVEQGRDDDREAATNLQLVSLDVVAARTARALGSSVSEDDVRANVEVSARGQADVASVQATSPNPRRAARLANTFAQQYIAFRREADRQKIAEARSLVQRELDGLSPEQSQTPSARSLRSRLEQLTILASLQTGNAEQVQVAQIPGSPSSPRPVRNALLGAIVGLLLGLGAALLLERLDRRIRDADEFSEIFERPILTTVPATDELADPQRSPSAAAAEAFRMLRANLRYFNVSQNVRGVLVTSPQPGDGKTTVAWHLASVSAASGVRTLLVEADLRRPTLDRWLNRSVGTGLSALLSHQATFEKAVQSVEVETPGGGGRSLDVVFAGSLPPNPDELIESSEMRELLSRTQETYDLVVIDTPPTSVVADAIPLVKEVSGVLVVGRTGKTTRDSANRLADQLENLDARVLGLVVNHVSRRFTGYGYGYGYGYGPDRNGSKAEPAATAVQSPGS